MKLNGNPKMPDMLLIQLIQFPPLVTSKVIICSETLIAGKSLCKEVHVKFYVMLSHVQVFVNTTSVKIQSHPIPTISPCYPGRTW